jgi:hypothetical protein
MKPRGMKLKIERNNLKIAMYGKNRTELVQSTRERQKTWKTKSNCF